MEIGNTLFTRVRFDHDQTSETFGEQVERCPACGRLLERKDLSAPRL